MRRVFVIAAIALIGAAVAQNSNPCEPLPTCETCIAHELCGWCSMNVTYKNGQVGGHCAGFSPDNSPPFQCSGIFSTEQCFAGYICDETDFMCKLGAPGQGNTLQKCQENCTNNGQVYLCNHTTLKCYVVPRGTPGSSSLAVCEASCAHPSPHPAPPTSSKPASLYACNTTTGTCEEAPVGKGEAKSVCEQQCKKINPNDNYICNSAMKTCQKLPPNTPGGESLAQCEAECSPTARPGPPDQLVGFWRGIQVQNNYVTGEFDLDINQTTVTYVQMSAGKVVLSWTGTPGNFPSSATQQMSITLTSGPDAGKIIEVLGVIGAPLPETKSATMAFSIAGGTMPASINSAMAGQNGQAVYAFQACLSQVCKFTLPALALNRLSAHRRHRSMHRQEVTDAPTDHCAQFAANCSYCLSQPFCGWCSVDIEYKDGSKGTQCAGFNSANGTGPAWKCNGRYSTFNCTEGYLCDHADNQCQATTPGNGMPLDECKQFCHPTPPPTPSQQVMLCNLTTKQCHPCPDNATNCPGAIPQGACEAECSHHKKGPPANLVGVWRGIYIQNGYQRVEVDVVFDNLTATFVQAGEEPVKCNVSSIGADLFIFDIIEGKYKGWTFAGMYQTAQQPDGVYNTMTLAAGKLGSNAPSTFDGAMESQGDHVYVINQCGAAPCTFKNPLGSR